MKISKVPACHVLDFETHAIQARPHYPPKPVGFSLQRAGERRRKYYAFGHPTGNNCTLKEATKVVKELWRSGVPILFQNAKFDVDVAQTHMGAGELSWDKIHDTLYLLFLNDPHALSLALKPAAEKELGMPPDEAGALRDWILAHVAEATPKTWGAFIALAPGDLVGRYADGDVVRTGLLFKKLYPKVVTEGMLAAYDRERQLMPVFLENERLGLRVDMWGLKRDIPTYRQQLALVEAWLKKRLKAKEINLDSDAEVAEALDRAGVVTEWELTKTGKRSTSKDNLTLDKFKDKKVFLALGHRNRLTTCLRLFMEPWYEEGLLSKGRIHPTWNQVRQPKGANDNKGTRTGRPSCSEPNLLNLAKSFEGRGDDYELPKFIKGLLPLPLVRQYMLPDEGCAWLHRDYNQQELRLLAHFEDGKLMQAYRDDPRLDVHTYIQEVVKQLLHKLFDRAKIKGTVFGRIYGQGLGSLAIKLRTTVEEVKQVREAQNKALPGLPELDRRIKANAKSGEPIVTWGGRVYYCEPPRYVERFKKEMSFDYKLLNYLIQGSAADATKEALIRYYYHPKRKKTWRFLVTVYDEINTCAPLKEKAEAMALLREVMESIEVDVPLLTDGKLGQSWGNLTKEKKYA